MNVTTRRSDIVLLIASLAFPTIIVLLKRGVGKQFLLNILLCLLAWIPGVLHAWYIIYSTPISGRRQRKLYEDEVEYIDHRPERGRYYR